MYNKQLQNTGAAQNNISLNYIEDIYNISYDSDNKEHVLPDSMKQKYYAINFDKYIHEAKIFTHGAELCPNDVLFFESVSNDEIIFIEFKNGKIRPANIRIKNYESILMLSAILQKPMEYFKDHLTYVLVYNPESQELVEGFKRNISKELTTMQSTLNNLSSTQPHLEEYIKKAIDKKFSAMKFLEGKIIKKMEGLNPLEFEKKYLA